MVNSVLLGIPLYFLSFCLFPTWVIKKIDKIRRNFFCKGLDQASGGYNLVSWGRLCKSKDQGGLSILDLAVFNKALLGKWWWHIKDSNRSS